MTPYEVELLMCLYSYAEVHRTHQNQLWWDTVNSWGRRGIVKEDACVHGYSLTALGQAWVKLTLSTPVPQHSFTDPRTGEVVEP